ncbi:alpha-2,3 sialyltransferase [Helicobacter cholecystus]|uniref:Alpha-2,3 sialyltransferase n=1 Tax=Helicobacter cholecystus TaxID=45498 RepID=A0A3D8IZ08_9HELI|nr:alpha-2,3-sialyltransferase [Helicobacter cholecystus]RDU70135.1 alpha-2,3 sialyltransferase [Helicobacter cholecystus]VEJ24687.1 bifunctional alpha-2,3/-2,8-sialyltransferase [Helicobacter cholecystus]
MVNIKNPPLKEEEKIKPIIIAGNGPSLAQIDYSLLPKDFDVFRCNQFYFENYYFLGKKIKGVFYNPFILKEQFFTLHHLKERGEYEVEDVYCNITMGIWDRQTWDGKPKNLEQELRYDFPSVQSTYPFLEQMKEFNALHKFYALYYEKRFTAGIIMLIVALAQGYREFYLTGIDFYENGGLSYAFNTTQKPHLLEKMPTFGEENFQDGVHEKNIDLQALKLALQIPNIKLYSLNPGSSISQIIPLAPKQNHPFILLHKPKDYIDDLLPLPLSSH